VSATSIFGALGFAGGGAWNLWLAWRQGHVTNPRGSYIRRRDNPLIFWVGVVGYSLFFLGGTWFLLMALVHSF